MIHFPAGERDSPDGVSMAVAVVFNFTGPLAVNRTQLPTGIEVRA
jgi:hypothetical protein